MYCGDIYKCEFLRKILQNINYRRKDPLQGSVPTQRTFGRKMGNQTRIQDTKLTHQRYIRFLTNTYLHTSGSLLQPSTMLDNILILLKKRYA